MTRCNSGRIVIVILGSSCWYSQSFRAKIRIAAASNWAAHGSESAPQDEILLVPVRDIASVVAEGELLHIRTGRGEKHTITYRLRDLESRIVSSRFIRLGRGTIVNLDMIKRIVPLPGGTYTVMLNNAQEFKVSRIQSRIIREQLLRL
jgi:DNA-binding LytR/AlgR family response regulator